LLGPCSSAQGEAVRELHPESIISCQLQFSNSAIDFPAHDVFVAQPGFDENTGFYTCSIHMQSPSDQHLKALSMSRPGLIVKAVVQGSHFSGEQISAQVPFNPGFYADQTDILLSNQNTATDVTVYGASEILSNLEVKSETSLVIVQEKESSSGPPSFVKYTVSITDSRLVSRGAVSTRLTISSPLTEQSIIIPVTVIHVADRSTAMQAGSSMAGSWEGAGIFQHFIDSYQVMFFTLFALLAGTAIIIIACHAFFSPREQVYHPAFIQKTPTQPGTVYTIPEVVSRVCKYYSSAIIPSCKNSTHSSVDQCS
ncbi:UNVERIFIED_CONTAM: hypothetical protein FKN15_027642, partial [Acipenser sinensis]